MLPPAEVHPLDKGAKHHRRKIMRQIGLRKVVFATVAFAAVFSVGWSDQHGLSLSGDSAQARARLYVAPYYYNPYVAGTSDTWYAVRAYYAGGPWVGTPANGWSYSWTG